MGLSLPDEVDRLALELREAMRDDLWSLMVSEHGAAVVDGMLIVPPEREAMYLRVLGRIERFAEAAWRTIADRVEAEWPDPGTDHKRVREAAAVNHGRLWVAAVTDTVARQLREQHGSSVLERVVVAGEDGGLVVREAAEHERVRGEALASLHGGLTVVQREAHEIVGAHA